MKWMIILTIVLSYSLSADTMEMIDDWIGGRVIDSMTDDEAVILQTFNSDDRGMAYLDMMVGSEPDAPSLIVIFESNSDVPVIGIKYKMNTANLNGISSSLIRFDDDPAREQSAYGNDNILFFIFQFDYQAENFFTDLLRGSEFQVRFSPVGQSSTTLSFSLHGVTELSRVMGIDVDHFLSESNPSSTVTDNHDVGESSELDQNPSGEQKQKILIQNDIPVIVPDIHDDSTSHEQDVSESLRKSSVFFVDLGKMDSDSMSYTNLNIGYCYSPISLVEFGLSFSLITPNDQVNFGYINMLAALKSPELSRLSARAGISFQMRIFDPEDLWFEEGYAEDIPTLEDGQIPFAEINFRITNITSRTAVYLRAGSEFRENVSGPLFAGVSVYQ